MQHQPYPSDLTYAQWAILKPLLPEDRPLGRPRKTSLRRVLDAILYRNRNGCTWPALPHDFPAWRTVYNYFQEWRDDATWAALNDALRVRTRRKARSRADSLGREHRQPDGQGDRGRRPPRLRRR